MKDIIEKESAVSPVIGVMLMLVVTIIIAAVVSAFSAGMADSGGSAAPQAKITGTYSLSSDVLLINHEGGDSLSTSKIILKIQSNRDDFGANMDLWGSDGTGIGLKILNKSVIANSAGDVWLRSYDGYNQVPVFRPGETMYYSPAGFAKGLTNTNRADLNPVGKRLTLQLVTTDGKLISQSDVIIDP
ncbi:MAG: type IV pilin N-terminal domain-containing protein [Methanomicrobium sp.]|nr:type IV pilin N-terminal domain-containing protein [Methanomicrobium sp.]